MSFDRHSPLWDRITLFLEKDSARDGRPENRYSREQFETVYIERCHSKGISAYRIDVSFKRGSSYAGAQWYTNEKELFEAFG